MNTVDRRVPVLGSDHPDTRHGPWAGLVFDRSGIRVIKVLDMILIKTLISYILCDNHVFIKMIKTWV